MNNYSRRDFIGKTTAGLAGATVAGISPLSSRSAVEPTINPFFEAGIADSDFVTEVKKLPDEKSYAYHTYLTEAPVHSPVRDRNAGKGKHEMELPEKGWKIISAAGGGVVLENAMDDFRDYLEVSHGVLTSTESLKSLQNWKKLKRCLVVGTKEQLPGCGDTLKGPKDYEIQVTPARIVVCGFDEHGAMFGLYHLESRMNLREAPFLPDNLNIVRHSLYQTRMVLSWMGWMEFPDRLLSRMAHDGFDAIFVSVYANPNGDRTTAETSTDFYARLLYNVRNQDPERIRDLINRAARYGIKVYTPVIWQYTGTRESEVGLRNLVREMVQEFPDIKGYVLLTEGFWYKKWGGGHGADKAYLQEWARNWCAAVAIVEEECHRINPSIEILPWEYNINFRPDNSDIKRYFITRLPDGVIPMLTWENGKSFEIDGMQGYLRDYALNQVGPAEVTGAQIAEARSRNMPVYSKVDTFASWQYGTTPYLPCPYQWFERYEALEKYGVSGTLESWSSGYKPNFISEIRAWTCWSGCPPRDELFGAVASRIFGHENRESVLKSWDHFSQAIRYVPDTGPNMGTNHAIGNPLFFTEPPVRTATFHHSWGEPSKKLPVNPYWPFTVSRMVFYPDFSNRTNKAELYARSATGIQAGNDRKLLPVFLKYLNLAIREMETGLAFYRQAALSTSASKRQQAVREVMVAEQLQRMMQSDHAILEFEDLRLQYVQSDDRNAALKLLDRMEKILTEEMERTRLSLLAATKDSRLGFQFEQDYVYTPYSLKEKLQLLDETLLTHIPAARNNKL